MRGMQAPMHIAYSTSFFHRVSERKRSTKAHRGHKESRTNHITAEYINDAFM